jgi:IS4 transposase
VAALRDRERREDVLAVFREELRELQSILRRSGRLERDRRVGAVAELLARRKGLGKRYFTGEIDASGQLLYRAKQRVLAYEVLLDGTTILRTNDEELSDEEVVARYKELARVERAFRDLKSFVDLRPVHHRAARRIAAHVFICVLSLLLERVIDRRLAEAKVEGQTAQEALRLMKRIRLLRDRVNGVEIERLAGLGAEQRRMLRALGIKEPAPLLAARRAEGI